MTSSSSPSTSEEEDSRGTRLPSQRRNPPEVPPMLKEELRLSIIARRHARGEGELQIELEEPRTNMELTQAEIDKKERRREQNRRAAQRCRTKKRLSQFNVIRNFERVVEQNEDLRQEVEVLRRQRDDLQKTLNHYRVSCTCFTTVKVEPCDNVVKTEPTADNPAEETGCDASPCKRLKTHHPQVIQDKTVSATQPLPVNSSSHFGPTQSLISTPLAPSDPLAPSYHQLSVQIHPHNDHLYQCPSQPQSTETHHQQQMWSSKQFLPQQHYPTSCMFSATSPKPSPEHHQHQYGLTHSQLQHQESQPGYTDDHHQGCFQQLSARRGPAVSSGVSSTNTPQASSWNNHYPDLCRLLQSQSSPCQVVPSLTSPCPGSGALRAGNSQGLTRRRSLSGESVGAQESSRPGTGELRFSSVSSEGSVYSDTHAIIYQELRTVEVPDIDNDDVFVGTTGGGGVSFHDLNNNNISSNNNNVESDRNRNLSESGSVPAVQRQDGRPVGSAEFLRSDGGSDNNSSSSSSSSSSINSSILEVGDVSSLLMQISSDELFFYSANEDSDPASDIISEYMSYTPDD